MTVIAVAKPEYGLNVVYELRDAERRYPHGLTANFRVLWGTWSDDRARYGNWMTDGFFGDDKFTFTEFPS